MALVLKDRVKETTTTTGTGTVTLAGAAAGFQSFAAVGDGNTTYYAIVDAVTGAWEVGTGTYDAPGNTLSRATVLSSSNSGSLVDFAAGSKDVFCTYPSGKSVYLDAAGIVAQLSFGALTATSVAMTTGTITTEPVGPTDIANKLYVDEVAEGLKAKPAVELATTANLTATYDNGASGVGATLTATANGAFPTIDGVTLTSTTQGANGVLVKDQTAALQNGRYNLTTVGDGSTPWVLTRCALCDESDEIPGAYTFVKAGTLYAGTGWVQTVLDPATFVVGTDAIIVVQFSGAGTFTAGTGLTLTGNVFSITNTGTAGTYGSASQVPVLTTNAQGQVTGVTNTAIAIGGSAVSGDITGKSGGTAAALTAGTFLTAGGTFDGSAARTFAVDATSANTASKVVARDASGNFSAGTITATLSGAATSATTATNLAGGAANRIAFQTGAGATNFAVAPTASNQVLSWNGSAFAWPAGTISGISLGSNLATLTFGTFLTGTSYNGSGAVTLATNATNANTASTLVARDASGNFSAGTITASLSGNATTSSSTSGNAATATALQTARTIGGVSFNGTANINLPGVNTAGNQNTTGSSASTTGNAATATALQTARTINGVSFNGTANITVADATKLPLAGGSLTGTLTLTGNATSIRQNTTTTWSGDAPNGVGKLEYHSNRWYINAGADSTEIANFRRGASSVATISNTGVYSGSISGNAATATALQTARDINGTGFNGTAAITTANWGTARTITIGSTGKSVNGSANVAWTLAEIGAGDVTLTGTQTLTNKTLTAPIVTQNVQVISAATTAVASRTYVLVASLTLTLPASPIAGNWVSVSNRSGTTTAVIARNGQNIMGLAENMTVDNLTASFTLTFADATRGWVFTL